MELRGTTITICGYNRLEKWPQFRCLDLGAYHSFIIFRFIRGITMEEQRVVPKTKNQHFVPQGYLRGFASRKGKLFAARRREDGSYGTSILTNARNLCAKRYYYEVPDGTDSTGKRAYLFPNKWEDWLGKVDEHLASELHDLLKYDVPEGAVNSKEAHRLMATSMLLLANLVMRNPAVLDPERENVSLFADSLVKDGLVGPDELQELDRQGIAFEGAVEEAVLLGELTLAFEDGPLARLLGWLASCGATLLISPTGAQFVTADLPFYCYWSNRSSDWPECVYLPLGNHRAVIFYAQNKEYSCRKLAIGAVHYLNRCIASQDGARTVIGGDRSMLDACVAGCHGVTI